MKKIAPSKRTENVRHALRDIVPIAQQVEKKGKKVIYLNIGDPMKFDYRTPEHMWKAMMDNKKEAEGYCNALGTDGARKAVANYANKSGAKGITMDDVMVTGGGSEAILMSLQALINPGENVLTPCPTYSIYTGEINFLEGKINEYYLNEEKNWQPDVDDIEKKINEKTKAIVLISPNNPTGSVMTKKTLQQIIDIAGAHDIFIYTDETYDQLLFDDEEFIPAASIAKDVPVVTTSSISKNYLAPGFRGGWLYKHDPQGALDDYFEAIKKLSRLRLGPVSPVQFAIEAALNGPQDHLKELVEKLQKRRDLTYKRLNEINGISCVKPKGAFYAYPSIELPIKSDKEFVLDLLEETGVLVVYGEGFGQKPGTHHFRIVFLPQEETLNEAFDKIEGYVKKKYS
ncbi:MAG: aminotransferase [Candidatus Diapherotrites archaeon CG11_big_fil_rev_8_21_14_0_20_37_9]|nr:MAG: aminotransferase [Candidatus Diapherotrites archaeon CG11_big_fil_rev_8_21_14_0_20_37_9]